MQAMHTPQPSLDRQQRFAAKKRTRGLPQEAKRSAGGQDLPYDPATIAPV